MKNLVTLLACLFTGLLCAQNVGVGTTTPHPSAALEVASNNGGLLIPRVDTTAIASPAAGLVVFQPSDQDIYLYNGSQWQSLAQAIELADADGDTWIRVENLPDEDVIRMASGGQEMLIIRNGRIDMPSSISNVIIGNDAGELQTGADNVLIGKQAGRLNTAGQNVMVGNQAGNKNNTGTQNTFIGHQAGLQNTIGHTNVFVGKDAGWENTEGVANVALGFAAGRQNQVGSANVFLGPSAGYSNNNPAGNNVFIGNRAGLNNVGSYNTYLGSGAGRVNQLGSDNVFLGQSAGYSSDNEFGSNVYVGSNAGYFNNGRQNIFIGSSAGRQSSDSLSTFIGVNAGLDSEGTENIIIGPNAGYANEGNRNTFIGTQSGNFTTNSDNVFIGRRTGYENKNGFRSVLFGNYAAEYDTASVNNVIIGYQAGRGGPNSNFLHSKNFNVLIGERAGNATQGSENTMVGARAGEVATGSRNIFIGRDAGRLETGNEKLYIDNTDTATPLIYGNLLADSLVVNGTLNINQQYTLPLTDGAVNQVLKTDGSGQTSWTNAAEDDDWVLSSNGFANFSSRFGIGVFNPSTTRKFSVISSTESNTGYYRNNGNAGASTTYGLNVENYNAGSGSKRGIYAYASSAGTGTKYGIYGEAFSSSTAPGFGGYFTSNFTNGTGLYAAGTKLAGHFVGSTYFDGQAGIGIESPAFDLHFANTTGSFLTQEVHLGMTNSVTGSSVNDGFEISYVPQIDGILNESHGRIWNHEAHGEIRFGTENAQRMVIDADGQVGMGTATTIDSRLQVHKAFSGDIPAKIRFTDNITGVGSNITVAGFEVGLGASQQGVILHNSAEDIEFYTNKTTLLMQLEADGDIDVGIAGESDQLRMNNGSMRLTNLGSSADNNGFKWAESTTDVFGIVYDGSGSGSSNRLNIREYNGTTSDIMTFEAGGDIGIGLTNPGFDLHLGNNSAAKPASSAWSITSDARSKSVLGKFKDGLATVLAINPIHYKYNGRYNMPAGLEAIGTVAQELQTVAPYMVNEAAYESADGQKENYLTIDYGAMDFVLINAIKELKTIIDQQNEKIEALEKQMAAKK